MRKLAFFALLAVVTVGCKPSPEKQVQGNWKASDVQLPAQLANNPMAGTLKSQLAGSTLEVKADKKYTVTLGGQKIEGDWSISERSATFQPKTVAGQSVADMQKLAQNQGAGAMAANIGKPSTVTLSEDGKTLKGDMMGLSFTFTKQGE